MTLLSQVTLTIGVCCNTATIIFLIKTYRSLQRSSMLLQQQMHQLYVKDLKEKINGTEIPSMAEDTEIAE